LIIPELLSYFLPSPQVLPNWSFIGAKGEEIGTTTIPFSNETTIWSANEVSVAIIQFAVLIAALGWDEIHFLPFVFIAPDRLRRIAHGITCKSADKLIHPLGIRGMRGHTPCQKYNHRQEYQ
jgi:hypothetical protein